MRIPEPIATFIRATNNHNTDAFLATLTYTAVISDEGQTIAESPQSKNGATKSISAQKSR